MGRNVFHKNFLHSNLYGIIIMSDLKITDIDSGVILSMLSTYGDRLYTTDRVGKKNLLTSFVIGNRKKIHLHPSLTI